jgi:hypothetical protein
MSGWYKLLSFRTRNNCYWKWSAFSSETHNSRYPRPLSSGGWHSNHREGSPRISIERFQSLSNVVDAHDRMGSEVRGNRLWLVLWTRLEFLPLFFPFLWLYFLFFIFLCLCFVVMKSCNFTCCNHDSASSSLRGSHLVQNAKLWDASELFYDPCSLSSMQYVHISTKPEFGFCLIGVSI